MTPSIATCSRYENRDNFAILSRLPVPDLLHCAESMKEYRAYLIGDDDRIISAIPLTCKGDDEAIATVKTFLADRAIEVWNGARFVIRLDPER